MCVCLSFSLSPSLPLTLCVYVCACVRVCLCVYVRDFIYVHIFSRLEAFEAQAESYKALLLQGIAEKRVASRYTHTLSLTFPCSLPLSFAHTHCFSLTKKHVAYGTLSLSPLLSLALSLSLFHTLTVSLSPRSVSPRGTHSLSPLHSLALSLSFFQKHFVSLSTRSVSPHSTHTL